jgi:hypothetical protein
MSLLGDVVGYGLVWLFGWYICIIGGIALIVAGIYFGVFILIALGVTFLIDGIIGLIFEKKFGKDLGGALAGSIFIISFGIMMFIFYLSFFSNIIFLFIGLVMIVLGAASMFFSIRKYKKAKLKEEKDKKVAEEGKINYNEQIGSILQMEKKTYEKSIEGVIYNYLEENMGKAFTPNSLFNRCNGIKTFNMDIDDVKKTLETLTNLGKIGVSEKEGEHFYHVL